MRVLLFLVLISTVHSYTVRFFLFTPKSPNNPIEIGSNNATKHIKTTHKLYILIHGWTKDPKDFYSIVRPPFSAQGTYNIVQVDYVDLAKHGYPQAVLGAPEIGQKVADFVTNLTQAGFPLKMVELLGFSLGAQISGFVGENIFKKLGQKLPRITGLDPAGPLFDVPIIRRRHLDATDAETVVVLHTDRYGLGYIRQAGTTDIYPNDGRPIQPGCSVPSSCNHVRSYTLYASAVAHPGSVIAAKCPNYGSLLNGQCNNTKIIDVGGEITTSDAGTYYLTTNSKEPFVSLIPAGEVSN